MRLLPMIIAVLAVPAAAENHSQTRTYFCDIDEQLTPFSVTWDDETPLFVGGNETASVVEAGDSLVFVDSDTVLRIEDDRYTKIKISGETQHGRCYQATNLIRTLAPFHSENIESGLALEVLSLKREIRRLNEKLLAKAKDAADGLASEQRRSELLSQQVAALMNHIKDLKSLLEEAKSRDAAKDIELQELGSQLNTLLARLAVERARRMTFEAEAPLKTE